MKTPILRKGVVEPLTLVCTDLKISKDRSVLSQPHLLGTVLGNIDPRSFLYGPPPYCHDLGPITTTTNHPFISQIKQKNVLQEQNKVARSGKKLLRIVTRSIVVLLDLEKYHLQTALFKPVSTMWSAYMLADHIVEKGLNKAVIRLYLSKANNTTREKVESPLGKVSTKHFTLR